MIPDLFLYSQQKKEILNILWTGQDFCPLVYFSMNLQVDKEGYCYHFVSFIPVNCEV